MARTTETMAARCGACTEPMKLEQQGAVGPFRFVCQNVECGVATEWRVTAEEAGEDVVWVKTGSRRARKGAKDTKGADPEAGLAV